MPNDRVQPVWATRPFSRNDFGLEAGDDSPRGRVRELEENSIIRESRVKAVSSTRVEETA